MRMAEPARFPGSSDMPLVLASASASRAAMLESAGLTFDAVPANVDEEMVKDSLRAEGSDAAGLADALAELKALKVSERRPEAFVIGADQVLVLDDKWFDKPADRTAARANLLELSGKSHRLVSAAVVMQGGRRIWGRTDHATLLMRPLTEAFVDAYLDAAGEQVLSSVGCYQLEGLGAHLFARVDGDWFTILGMPLLPLLDFLRGHGVVPQ